MINVQSSEAYEGFDGRGDGAEGADAHVNGGEEDSSRWSSLESIMI